MADEKYRGVSFFLLYLLLLPLRPLSLSPVLSVFFFLFYAENRVPRKSYGGHPPSGRSTPLFHPRDVRSDYEMLNGTAVPAAARYSSKFYSFWQLAGQEGLLSLSQEGEVRRLGVAARSASGCGQALRGYSSDPLYFRPSRDYRQDFRFDNFADGFFLARARARATSAKSGLQRGLLLSSAGIIFFRRAYRNPDLNFDRA